jgi:hypothetical protein
MSVKRKIMKLLFIGFLAIALLGGAPMRPDEIEELLCQMNQPKVAHTLREGKEHGDKPPK